MTQVISSLIEGLTLLLGPLFGAGGIYTTSNITSLERFICFLLTFIFWIAFEKQFQNVLLFNEPNAKTVKRKILSPVFFKYLSLIVSGLFAFGILHVLRNRSESDFFHLVLFSILLRMIASISDYKGFFIHWLFARFLYNSLLGALSFLVITQRMDWQPFIASSGFALLILALHLAELPISTKPKTFSFFGFDPTGPFIQKLYALALFGGPMIISALCIFRQLPKNYVFILIVIPFARTLPARFEQLLLTSRNRQDPDVASTLYNHTQAVVSATLVIIALLSSFS
ncbi:MAG: hypothetical protein SGJ02_13335 [bacterium]|nr:hypothetical protein [bacterium]